MSIRQTTRDILRLVEETSNIPVRVTEDPKLETFAVARLARQGISPVHVILFKPDVGQTPDYKICFECGYILRLFSNPPEQRFDLADAVRGQEEVEKMLTAADGLAAKYGLRKTQVQELRSQYLGGLLTHLRSVPVGLRISEWLASNYPDLQPLEKEHVQNELNINHQSLQPEIKQATPKKVYQAAQSISAAYALFWSQKHEKPEIFNPYRLQGFEKDAQALLDIFEQTPDDPTYDKALIDKWAEKLGVAGWYSWKPYQPPI